MTVGEALQGEARTEFLRSVNQKLRDYFPGCAVIVAVASEGTGMSLAAGGPDPAEVAALASQVADEIIADLAGQAPSGQVPS